MGEIRGHRTPGNRTPDSRTPDIDIIKMSGYFQYDFLHAIPPADIEDCGPRLNFTFRNVRNHHPKCPLYA